MKKVIVIGCPGAGKTTFAEALNKKTGIPLFYLDAIWHRPDRTHISREEYDARLGEILKLDSWIIDGNYSRTVETRMDACDTVFLFDLPVPVCLEGATSRLGKKRYDMPWVMKMEFKELLIRAKRGENNAREELLKMYEGLLVKKSIVEGVFNEDLYQELCYKFMLCIDKFEL